MFTTGRDLLKKFVRKGPVSKRTQSPAQRVQRQLRTERLEERTLMAADFDITGQFGLNTSLPTADAQTAYVSTPEATSNDANNSEPNQGVKSAPDSVAVVTSKLANRILVVRGTSQDDTITVKLNGGGKIAVASSTAGGPESSVTFKPALIDKIVVDGASGNDTITLTKTVNINSRLFGAYGDDTMYGGNGIDEMFGGMNNDKLYGRAGNDFMAGGGGTDEVLGGAGFDTVFQGSFSRTRVQSAMEAEIFRLTNEQRVANGLPALLESQELNFAANTHASTMADLSTVVGDTNAHSHNLWGVDLPTVVSRIDFSGVEQWRYSENIAYGYATAQDVVTAWMNSAGHRANILDTQVTHFGVGAKQASDGQWFYTQNFMQKA